MIEKLIVGSVKSNIGHLEASAALISIVLKPYPEVVKC